MTDANQPRAVADQAGVSLLAYQMWKDAGCPQGQDQKFWFEAEARIRATAKATPAAPQPPASVAPTSPKTTVPPNSAGTPFNPIIVPSKSSPRPVQKARRA
jgi:hypothetical protein